MDRRRAKELLEKVAQGDVSPDEALGRISEDAYSDLGFAKVDHQRGMRQGVSEVIYGEGKTAEQIADVVVALLDGGEERVLITRIDAEKAQTVERLLIDGLCYMPDLGKSLFGSESAEALGEAAELDEQDIPDLPFFTYYDAPRLAIVGEMPPCDGAGRILVVTGGTSDIPVAEEAALTAEMLGNEVVRLYDVGVAGLHRLLSHGSELLDAQVIIAVAGMEGALSSVVAGLVSCPVIAVPTSVGYGASFGGLSALLSMLNSCASGVSVVNIDNGFGAGYQASLINHIGSQGGQAAWAGKSE